MNAKERRDELTKVARELTIELRSMTVRVNAVIASLVSESDSLVLKMIEEGMDKPKTRSLTLDATPEETEMFNRRTRHCSLCGGSGHDARTCDDFKAKK